MKAWLADGLRRRRAPKAPRIEGTDCGRSVSQSVITTLLPTEHMVHIYTLGLNKLLSQQQKNGLYPQGTATIWTEPLPHLGSFLAAKSACRGRTCAKRPYSMKGARVHEE